MITNSKKPGPLFLFYLLVAYVLIQFVWWSYLMVKLNNEVLEQRLHIIELSTSNPSDIKAAQLDLHTKLQKRWLMIAGEGSVFLILLITGFIQTRKTFKKEADLNTRQRNFLLSVTHELKSPIASAKLQLETLLKHELSKDKQAEILNNALSDTERLNVLVENVLIATRLEDSTFKLFSQELNFSEFLKQELNKNTAHFQGIKKHTIELAIQDGIDCKIDAFAFISILTNLYENAIKYSANNLAIKVTLQKNENAIQLLFADNGNGIEESEWPFIFDKFYRVGNEETRKNKGTGLGLYIVKKLVQNHRGTIKILKNSPKGSIFEINLYD
jgi:two-component system, OmpR family, phosphate regulon sensor histidine kinase PhoR